MTQAPSAAASHPPVQRLPGNRLHLQEGPIDLVVGAEGAAEEVESAYVQAAAAFEGLLAALVAELPLLRQPVPSRLPPPRPWDRRGQAEARDLVPAACARDHHPGMEGGDRPYLARFRHPAARAMAAACLPHAGLWVTPMAAVAGAVADHVLAAMTERRSLGKAWVNDGGDIAFHLAPGAVFELGLVTDLADGAPRGLTSIAHDSPVRGVATSGRQGRSLSRGIADAVTVLARSAAGADAAATLIANAVDLEEHPAILRRPACDLAPDSDLGALPVVVAVGPLAPHEIERALGAGAALAEAMCRAGLIDGALLSLRGKQRAVPHRTPARKLGEPAQWS